MRIRKERRLFISPRRLESIYVVRDACGEEKEEERKETRTHINVVSRSNNLNRFRCSYLFSLNKFFRYFSCSFSVSTVSISTQHTNIFKMLIAHTIQMFFSSSPSIVFCDLNCLRFSGKSRRSTKFCICVRSIEFYTRTCVCSHLVNLFWFFIFVFILCHYFFSFFERSRSSSSYIHRYVSYAFNKSF